MLEPELRIFPVPGDIVDQQGHHQHPGGPEGYGHQSVEKTEVVNFVTADDRDKRRGTSRQVQRFGEILSARVGTGTP